MVPAAAKHYTNGLVCFQFFVRFATTAAMCFRYSRGTGHLVGEDFSNTWTSEKLFKFLIDVDDHVLMILSDETRRHSGRMLPRHLKGPNSVSNCHARVTTTMLWIRTKVAALWWVLLVTTQFLITPKYCGACLITVNRCCLTTVAYWEFMDVTISSVSDVYQPSCFCQWCLSTII